MFPSSVEPQPEPADALNTGLQDAFALANVRVELIKRQMDGWRKRNPGLDFGR